MSTDPLDPRQPQQPVTPEPADARPTTSQPAGQPMTGLGMGGHPYVPHDPSPSHPPSKALIAVAAAGLLLAGFGAVRALLVKPEPRAPRAPVESVWSQQQRMANEAMNMAREAQRMQREHIQQMERAMYESEFGYVEETDADQ